MEAEVYPSRKVEDFINSEFIPVKIHVKQQPQTFKRFNAVWTPTQILMDPEGVERYRLEGFLAEDDFLAQLKLGLGRMSFERGDFKQAEKRFEMVCNEHPASSSAAEGCYWAGVSRYKDTNDGAHLAATGKLLRDRYPQSEWAKRGEVWLPQQAA